MDFTKLQEAATISKEALAKKTTEKQKALEQSFVDAMKSWEDAVKTKEAEASKDTTKSSEALQVRSNFDTFKNNLETEVRNLLNQEQAEKKEVEQQTKTETEKLLDVITQDSIAIISAANELYKDKTRADMVHMDNLPAYINAFQTIIIQLGASTGLDDKSMDKIGPITRAGVKTIQKYLNDTYQAGLDIDGIPGPKTLEALLAPVSSTDTTTRLEKMLSEKPKLTLFSVEVVNSTKTNKKIEKNKTENTKKKGDQKTDIPTADPEKLPPEVKFKQIQEQLIKKHQKLDKSLIPGWAEGIQRQESNGQTGIIKKSIKGKLYYFNQDRYLTPDYNKALQYEQQRTTKLEKTETKEISSQQQEIITKYNLKEFNSNKTINSKYYKDKNGDFFFKGKDGSFYKIGEDFSAFYISKIEDKFNNNFLSWENNKTIDTLLQEIGNNDIACAKLIEMCVSGMGTHDEQLSKILTYISKQKNFIQVTNAYKALGFDINGKDNLFDMLLTETSNTDGYDVYFIKFFEGLLKNNSDYIKDLIIKKGRSFPKELFNNKTFVTRRKENNIEWDRVKGRQETEGNKKVKQKQKDTQATKTDIVKDNRKQDTSANNDDVK